MALPSGYKRLKYIEANGNQYINFGVAPNSNFRIVMDVAIQSAASNRTFFCSRTVVSGTDTTSNALFLIASTNTYRRDYYGETKSTTGIVPIYERFTVDANKNVTTFGDDYTLTFSTKTGNSPTNLMLFASGTGTGDNISSLSNYAHLYCYGVKVYDGNGALIRDGVPAQNSEKVNGLYDLVENKFYVSLGTDGFIAPLSVKTGDILNYDYTGTAVKLTLPKGIYKFECWGAQGGYRSSSTYGGKGGYAAGTMTFTTPTDIFIRAGGSGNTGGTAGGFNGGGSRPNYKGGGGASDIRIGQDSLYARVIVAGGGGSDGASNKTGMYGGGTSGGSATESYGTGGGGGTQTAGGAGGSNNSGTFGQGGAGINRSSGYGGAGGGGWYGGGGSYPDSSGDDDRGGGGGSGYVYTASTASSYPSGCLLNSAYYLESASTTAGNASMPSPTGSTETGHSGNGYIRITVIKAQSLNIPVNVGNSWKNGDAIFVNIGGTWKNCESAFVNINGAWKELS